MRGRIIDALFQRMAERDDLFFLTADMGINLVERFQEAYPDRFLNVGIAEQNLIGVAAGLANVGYRPFVYTISNFAVHRCFEQVRNDVALHGHPVTILGTSAGYDNAPLGPTHHIIDEWGPLRSIVGVDVYSPSDVTYADGVVDRVLERGRPAYVRIPKGGFKTPGSSDDLVHLPGEGGGKVLLCAYGSVAQTCLAAQEADPSLSVLVFNRLHPLDEGAVAAILAGYDRVIAAEDHTPDTGLFGALATLAARRELGCRLISRAPDRYVLEAFNDPTAFHARFGFDLKGLSEAVKP